MNEAELYKELGVLTKDRDRWEESIPFADVELPFEMNEAMDSLTALYKTEQV